jgi:hypothetical protein
MIVPQIACLADASRVQLPIPMLTQFGHLDSPLRMIAILAHATRIVVVCHMLTQIYLLPVLDLSSLFFNCGSSSSPA